MIWDTSRVRRWILIAVLGIVVLAAAALVVKKLREPDVSPDNGYQVKVTLGHPVGLHHAPGTVFAIGDSITAHGGSVENVTPYSWLAIASQETGGRLRIAGASATPGITAQQVLRDHLPVALAVQPQFCVVLAGTNNVDKTSFSLANTSSALRTMYTSLSDAGITPVAETIPPVTQVHAYHHDNIIALNAWIRSYARAHHLPLVDQYAVLVGPGDNYRHGLNFDQTHPNERGVLLMGKLLAKTLAPFLPHHAPKVIKANPILHAGEVVDLVVTPRAGRPLVTVALREGGSALAEVERWNRPPLGKIDVVAQAPTSGMASVSVAGRVSVRVVRWPR